MDTTSWLGASCGLRVRHIASAAVAMLAIHGTVAHAVVCDVAAVTSTGGFSLVPILNFIVGGTEIGYITYVATTGGGDPPDLVNFHTVAAPPLLVPAYQPITGGSAALNATGADVVLAYSELHQLTVGIQASRDRLEGAHLIGTAADIALQTNALASFESQARNAVGVAGAKLGSFTALFANEFPSEANTLIPTSLVKQTRDLEASGSFPSGELTFIAAWEMSPFEIAQIQARIAQVTDAQIDAVGPLTMFQAMSQCAECDKLISSVPEPATWGLMGGGLVALLLRRRHRPA